MSRPSSSASITDAIGKLLPQIDCPTCQSPRAMTMRRVYPALYCGKNVVFYECADCGTARTEQVADDAMEASMGRDRSG